MSNSELTVPKILESIKKSNNIHIKNRGRKAKIERAIFLSWHCELANCKFCYMSTQEAEPLAIRRVKSVLTESIITDALGWELEFLTSGYGYSGERLEEVVKQVSKLHDIWLNTGGIPNNLENIEGVVGSIETVNPTLHKSVAPQKPLDKTIEMLKEAKSVGLKTGITIILGLGETIEDLNTLIDLIKELELDRITFYSLNPQEGTIYEDFPFPTSLYYAYVVSQTRINFPNLDIFTGIWTDKIPMLGPLMAAGSDAITKFPLEIIGTKEGRSVEKEIKSANRKLEGSMIIKEDFKDKLEEKERIFKDYQLKEDINLYLDKINSDIKL